jgi:hypothetical protein
MRGDNVKEQITLLTTPILGPSSHDMDNKSCNFMIHHTDSTSI